MVKGLVVGLLVLGFASALGCRASTPPTIASTPALPRPAPTAEGVWDGTLKVGGGSVRVIVRIKRTGSGWAATADSPDQGASGIPVDSVDLTDDRLKLDLLGLHAHYEAHLAGDLLSGTFTQYGRATPLELTRRTAPVVTSLEGAWIGTLHAGGANLRLLLKIRPAAGGWAATADSIDQHIADIPVDSVSVEGDKVKLILSSINGSYEARLAGDTLIGTFTQSGVSLPLELVKTAHPPVVTRRPQTPKRPLPYDELDVSVENAAARVTLACTRTEPRAKGPFGAVVLTTGSGPQNRDEALMGHSPFLVLSDAITRQGVAVLRCDDRGVFKSTGAFGTATTFDFADDTLAEVAALRARPEIAPAHVGVLGHSEGGEIATIAAAKSRDVAFIVLLAGTALPGDQILDLQRGLMEQSSGMSAAEIADSKANWDKAFAIINAEKADAVATKRLRELYDGLPAATRAQFEKVGGFETQVKEVLSPWFRTFLALDPRTFLARVKVPVLAINGARDWQVPPSANLPEMKKALAHDHDVTVQEMPGLNHLFQTAKTGSPAEYGEIEETISPAVLTLVSGWIAHHAR
ncbi:MAG TPA: alpha/beta fold hydrolase [Polyangia bacterium]|nr:alpha/beta fold hydrolase [Polyangia bacterium]